MDGKMDRKNSCFYLKLLFIRRGAGIPVFLFVNCVNLSYTHSAAVLRDSYVAHFCVQLMSLAAMRTSWWRMMMTVTMVTPRKEARR